MVVLNVTVNDCTPSTIVLGRRGTYNTEEITFDVSYLIENYGDGTAVLAIKRSQDESAYPAVVAQDGSMLTWTVSETDTAYVGSGECQLMWYVDGGLAKTIIYPMVVMRDILSTEETPPDGYENWIEHLTELGAETLQNAQDAAQSANDAETAKGKAEDSQQAAEIAASHYPIVENNYWMVWDVSSGSYVSTGVLATGEDGYSPVVTVTSITGGHRVTITDKEHPQGQSFDVLDGQGGGTSDYTNLANKPQINGHTLTGNQTAEQLGLATPNDIPDDAGDIGYDSRETYASGTAGAALNDLFHGVVKAIPAGGNEGQILAKASDSDYDTEWIDNTGGGGTGNYNELTNKPSINGIELNGDKSLSELGIASKSDIPTIPVESVNGKTGKVVLTPLDVGAYEKPASGIPKTDLAADVKNSLNKADTALQSAPVTSVNGKTGTVEIEIPNINPDSKTSEMTKSVGVDSDGKLWTTPDNQSGTSDYSELENKPKINNVELSGNKTASDLGLATPSDIPAVPVKSVNGKTGNVSIDAGDIGFDAKSSYSENTVGERIEKFNELMEILDDNFIPFPYTNTDKETYGIRWTVNNDGSITANGTATRNTTFLVAAWTIEQGSIPINPEFEYVLSGSPQGASDSTYFVGARYYAEGVTPSSSAGTLARDRGEGALVKNSAYISIYCAVMKDATVDNIQFKPKLSYTYGELSPADFYKNGEGIIGSDEIKFLQRSALLDKAIVSPSKYGAAGNGLTDDTNAIQQCFDENPNAIIIFERGDYLIKNELSLYGNQGGQVVIFGGANIIWGGDVEPDLAMISVNKVDYSESRTLIIGGMFWGNDRIGTGIKSVKFHTTISDCKIVDVTKEGIAIGSLTDRDSLQNVVRNCMVMMSSKSSQEWSDGNNVVGISLYAPDGFVSGLNVNRCKVGAYLMGINYVFVNCHFTTQYREQKATMADTYGVLIDPSSSGKIGTHMFENVYFDNAKYVIYAGKQNKISVDISNSFYFNSGNQTTDIVDAFMVGGYPVNVHVNHFTVISAEKKCRFFDATFCNGITMKEMDMITQKYDRTWYELLQGVPYVASNLCNPGESACFIYDRAIEANKMVEVGCVLVNGSDPSLSGGMTFHYRNGTHGEAVFSVKYSTEDSKLIVSNKQVVVPESGMWFAISPGEALSVNGSTKTMFKIYYGSDNGITNAQATISCDYAAPNQFYVDPNDGEIINADGLSNYTIIDIN